MKVGFIGFGKMGSALASGVSGRYVAFDPRVRIKNRTRSIADLVRRSELIFICVKPQQMGDVLKDLARIDKKVLRKKGFVSIAAGVEIKTIQKALGSGVSVIRVMPNTPALLSSGASAVCAGRFVKAAHRKAAEKILKKAGVVVRVLEKKMNAVTAVSGSGPAYVFYLAEAMIAAARKEGLSASEARTLTHQTIFGAGKMLSMLKEPADKLRKNVTSPGGTTAAAIREFDRRKLKRIVQLGIHEAVKRANQLSRSGA